MLAATSPLAIWIPVFVATIAGLFGWIQFARRFGGRIESSEAKELWGEVRSQREASEKREERQALRQRQLEEKIDHLESVIVQLRETIQHLETIINKQRAELEAKR